MANTAVSTNPGQSVHESGTDPASVDPPGTCHLVGCEGKGTIDEHARKPIGCPDTFAPYDTGHCLGFPVLSVDDVGLIAYCSIDNEAWNANFGVGSVVTPTRMAELVDGHRSACPNRSTL